jgi:type IV pilus assembly protein PilA
MQKILKKRAGFTLVEVLVVVVIIAILAAIAVPIYLQYVASARASEAQEAISAIMAASKVFQAQNGHWPSNITQLKMLTLDRVTTDRWRFTIIAGGTGIASLTATSTGLMPGGAGHTVTLNVLTGKYSGYGVD